MIHSGDKYLDTYRYPASGLCLARSTRFRFVLHGAQRQKELEFAQDEVGRAVTEALEKIEKREVATIAWLC